MVAALLTFVRTASIDRITLHIHSDINACLVTPQSLTAERQQQ
jgi:hypothetical protein